MSKSFTILVDMDDTIEHLLEAWLFWLNTVFGRQVAVSDIHSWDMTQAYPGLTADEVYAPLTYDSFWDSVKPFEDAPEVLKRLSDDGHRLFIVTSSDYRTLRAKMEKVLFRYFPFIDWKQVIITYNKQMIRGDILIDDAPHNLVGGDFVKILMDAPHNRGFDAAENGMLRVSDWKTVEELIRTLAQKTE